MFPFPISFIKNNLCDTAFRFKLPTFPSSPDSVSDVKSAAAVAMVAVQLTNETELPLCPILNRNNKTE
jgi:hypothetical protein